MPYILGDKALQQVTSRVTMQHGYRDILLLQAIVSCLLCGQIQLRAQEAAVPHAPNHRRLCACACSCYYGRPY